MGQGKAKENEEIEYELGGHSRSYSLAMILYWWVIYLLNPF